MRIRIAAAIVALCAVAMTAPAAHAYRLSGERWPGRTITYYDATAYKDQVRAAVRTWNASGVRIRFKAAARSRAQVRIASGGRKGCFGFAQIGYSSGRRAKVQLGAGCAYVSSMTGIVAHELGHILGLVHEDRRCAAMNTVLDAHCGLQPAFEYRCRLLERDDVRGAVTRYGGRVRPVRADPYCPSFAAPQAPAIRTIASTGGSVDAGVAIAEPHRLVADAGPVIFAELLVYRYADACPPDAGAGRALPALVRGLRHADDEPRRHARAGDVVLRRGGRRHERAPQPVRDGGGGRAGAGARAAAVRARAAAARAPARGVSGGAGARGT